MAEQNKRPDGQNREAIKKIREQERIRQVKKRCFLLACGLLLPAFFLGSIFLKKNSEIPAYVENFEGVEKEGSSGTGTEGSINFAAGAEGVAGLAGAVSAMEQGCMDTQSDRALYLAALQELVSEEPEVGRVLERKDEYPDNLLKMLSNNLETLDFVLDYPDKKDQPCEKTIGLSVKKGEVPLLLQWDERWGYGDYGKSCVGASGCGPTCIAMVAAGLTGRTDITPYTVAAYSEANGYLTEEMDTSWDLMTSGCEAFGIHGTMLGLDKSAMVNTLDNGCPIICSMGPGDFTDYGHFIVLTDFGDGAFQINDPNSQVRSSQSWTYETLEDQIVNLWYYTLVE